MLGARTHRVAAAADSALRICFVAKGACSWLAGRREFDCGYGSLPGYG
jgi:hypothetical protein